MAGKPDRDDLVLLSHGSGGQRSLELVRDEIVPMLQNPVLAAMGDAGVLDWSGRRLAVTTDSFVVAPLFFPGGDIGSLAVNGTLNDLAVAGAEPVCLTLSFILEEGLPKDVLTRVLGSVASAAKRARVRVVAGDTKVVERGSADRLFACTTGVGRPVSSLKSLAAATVKVGDSILVSGTVGDHGAVIRALRAGIDPGPGLASDCANVWPLVRSWIRAGIRPRFMRDPTRGGLTGVLCDLAEQSGLGIRIRHSDVPVLPAVLTVCDITGMDPLHLACEGRIVAVVPRAKEREALRVWRRLPQGRGAACIGEIVAEHPKDVEVGFSFGGSRLLLRPAGEILPRIC